MKKLEKKNGITLISLVITIVILLILAGISISALAGKNGLFTKVKQANKAHVEAEMKEQLTLALHDLQLEKKGEATLDDVTQEWLNTEIKDYEPNLKEDATLEGKIVIMSKNNVIGKFLIDSNLNIAEIEYNADCINIHGAIFIISIATIYLIIILSIIIYVNYKTKIKLSNIDSQK